MTNVLNHRCDLVSSQSLWSLCFFVFWASYIEPKLSFFTGVRSIKVYLLVIEEFIWGWLTLLALVVVNLMISFMCSGIVKKLKKLGVGFFLFLIPICWVLLALGFMLF